MVKKKLVKGTMLTALAALGMSLNLSSGEFDVTAYAADNPAVISADTYSREEEPGDDELSMEQYIVSLTTTADAGGWRIEDGVPYWYENGVKQGTEGRGKEIYDPGSNAWYWLDAVDGGRMAVSKDVYQESKADDEGNIGKWVRYDADGHMVKGWQTAEAGTYFFDYTYGTMYKGDKVIDGVSYHFDETTGILDGGAPTDDNGSSFAIDGWHTVGGTEYWYEGGIRQGVRCNADGSLDTSYRGKEIYDPGSNAWYWLDCVQNGAKAVSKDVYQESKAAACPCDSVVRVTICSMSSPTFCTWELMSVVISREDAVLSVRLLLLCVSSFIPSTTTSEPCLFSDASSLTTVIPSMIILLAVLTFSTVFTTLSRSDFMLSVIAPSDSLRCFIDMT